MRWSATMPWLLCATLAWAPAAAHAQADELADPRLDAVRPQLTAALDAAEREGLPGEWLRDKVAEGLSKRVPAPLVARAVETLLDRMRVGDRLVRDVAGTRGQSRRLLLRSAVDALSAGAPAERLGPLVREAAGGDRATAALRVREVLVAVAELGEREFSGAAAVEAVHEAYRRGRRRGLGELLQRARRIGGAEGRDQALRQAGRGVGRGPVDPRGQGADHGRHGPPEHRGRPR